LKLTLAILLAVMAFAEQAAPPPPPPAPPRFMSMKDLPLDCFNKPAFEEDGMDFFVCNGVAGLAGVRKKADSDGIVWVGDLEIAQNLNMQSAKRKCGKGSFAVRGGANFSFLCDGEVIALKDRFQAVGKADWKRYQGYLK